MIPTTNSPTIAAVGVRQIPKSYFVEDQSEPARTLRTVFTKRTPTTANCLMSAEDQLYVSSILSVKMQSKLFPLGHCRTDQSTQLPKRIRNRLPGTSEKSFTTKAEKVP
ncbi:unnamed protein product [Ceratitis capitata]|uniref:(Mediterranean fruit fly) hypothetical protein n=1 Tax=Ceratitis capitata TaxID=7213 RepID=A0A811U1N3_CERCA|nr:unnamed protein product [Ceratitis capitata]